MLKVIGDALQALYLDAKSDSYEDPELCLNSQNACPSTKIIRDY